ncbi:ORC1-type DNA replication protein [Methanofollis formosanus]|uniref:ORC1-type DNA replication protein n=1 Tax=Methanofollis formosanus TaxID=299308 RepID=A0A8G0ZZV0_9EURY|nr:ORC1-type DNA replication protein [Methanofollis formosanus]QYZ78637.1 ORC1-type DNA replication protein [Methanofollis formosanus]
MTPRYLMADQALFRDPSLFETHHLPEVFNYRDAQLKDLAFALRPTLYGARPLNTLLQGPPGTGKTTAVRRLFAEVEETTPQVVPILVSCLGKRTTYAVLSQIYLTLFNHSPPSHGPSSSRILSEIGDNLARRGAVLVVCLDDANHLVQKRVLNDVLIRILRLHEFYPGARTGVVMTDSSMDLPLHHILDPSTWSSLQASTISFPPYSADEVRSILADRVRAGVYPGVVPPAVLDDVAERTVGTADLRIGMDLMKGAVHHAERAGQKTVTVGDVETVFAVVMRTRLASTVQTLTPTEQSVLAVLAGMADRREETTSGRVYEAVTAVEPMSYTMFHERVQRLEGLRLVRTRRRKKGQGRTREIVVREGVSDAVSAGSSGESMNGCIGVADDEKRRYETGGG